MPMNAAKLLLLNVLGGSAEPAFSPADISGLALWLDASDAATLFQASNGTTPAAADGDVVGYWGDKSGNGRSATQGTTAKKPLLKTTVQNGLNAVWFDGSDDRLSAGVIVAQPTTWFMAVNWVSGDFLFDGVLARQAFYRTTPSIYAGSEMAVSNPVLGEFIYTLQFNGVASAAWKNGASIGTGNTGASGINTLNLGTGGGGAASDCSESYFYEMLLYDSVLSDANRNAVIAYLNTKWGVY